LPWLRHPYTFGSLGPPGSGFLSTLSPLPGLVSGPI